MKTECKTEMLHKDYRAVPACHKSALKHVKTAKHLEKYERKNVSSDALRFGRMFHTALLEPHLVGENLEVYEKQEWIPKAEHPDGLSINEQKANWKAERDDQELDYYLKAQEAEDLQKMVDAVRGNPLAAKYLRDDALIESKLFWTDPRTGMPCKSMIDMMLPSEDIIIEVKSDVDPCPEAFGKKIYNLGYHVGAWFNREGYRQVFGRDLKAFIYIVPEKCDPYSVGVYLMNAHDFDAGEIDGVPLMKRYQIIKQGGLQDHNHGEAGDYEILPVQTPRWVLHKLDGDGEIDVDDDDIDEGGEL